MNAIKIALELLTRPIAACGFSIIKFEGMQDSFNPCRLPVTGIRRLPSPRVYLEELIWSKFSIFRNQKNPQSGIVDNHGF
jgi:hypothetical protein